jgi:hypothetical protein
MMNEVVKHETGGADMIGLNSAILSQKMKQLCLEVKQGTRTIYLSLLLQ